GFENLPAIAGMAAALRARTGELAAEAERLRALDARLWSRLPEVLDDVAMHGPAEGRLPGLVAFSVLYVDGEALLLGLDQRGIAVHSGSSCTSSTEEPSHVLAAMRALTHGSVRVSMGRDTSEADVDAFLDALVPVVAKARGTASLDAEALARAERER
ncbi:MAG TPA: aminotransferase class V-fold PLP-dependent enzyme, partial [Actinomycetota bacterium]